MEEAFPFSVGASLGIPLVQHKHRAMGIGEVSPRLQGDD